MLQQLPKGVAKMTSVEGITEYSLENGLKVLMFPDPSKPTITVNVTYLVGSRHEGYGETGMAHLLEHLGIQRALQSTINIPQELTEHGARPNGNRPGTTVPTILKRFRQPKRTSNGHWIWNRTGW